MKTMLSDWYDPFPSLYGLLGLDLSGVVFSDESDFQLYVTVTGAVVGGNENLYEYLPGDLGPAFFLTRFGGGILLRNTVRIGVFFQNPAEIVDGGALFVQVVRR